MRPLGRVGIRGDEMTSSMCFRFDSEARGRARRSSGEASNSWVLISRVHPKLLDTASGVAALAVVQRSST